jgi:hypothetical protein
MFAADGVQLRNFTIRGVFQSGPNEILVVGGFCDS